MADKRKNSKAIFSALLQESTALWPKEDQEWLLGGAKSSWDLEKLTKDLHVRLLNGAKNELPDRDLRPAISLKAVARFLASLELATEAELVDVVKHELSHLGIARRGRGRRPGRISESRYALWVGTSRQFVEQCGILSSKTELQQKYPRNWLGHFERLLGDQRWPSSLIHELARSRTPEQFAMWLATDYFSVSIEHIKRACRRAKRAARK